MRIRVTTAWSAPALATTLCAALLSPTPASAWLRPIYEDAVVVARSKLIVVGHLRRDSIVYLPHKRKPHGGNSWEHHAVLVVRQVLKGTVAQRELPIIIHYGLTPVVGGRVKRRAFSINLRGTRRSYPRHVIEVLDTGNSSVSFTPLVKDAGQDNLWFLRRRSGTYGRLPGTGSFGIVDPEDLRPLALRDYYLAYLAADPPRAVRAYLARGSPGAVAARARRYLDHLEVLRIKRDANPTRRARRLLPFFLRRQSWGLKLEAKEALVGCGRAAGPPLLRPFDDPTRRARRGDIMAVWRKTRYAGCVRRLVRLLLRHDRFWAGQQPRLKGDWWNSDVDSAVTERRRRIYGEVHDAVLALGAIADRRGRRALVRTLARWRAINFSNPQIVEACEAALAKMK